MTYRESKQIIRAALGGTTDAKLVELLDAGRDGGIPWSDCYRCLSGRLYGLSVLEYIDDKPGVSKAYLWLGLHSFGTAETELRGQRRLVPMVLAEIRRRNREKGVADIDKTGGRRLAETAAAAT